MACCPPPSCCPGVVTSCPPPSSPPPSPPPPPARSAPPPALQRRRSIPFSPASGTSHPEPSAARPPLSHRGGAGSQRRPHPSPPSAAPPRPAPRPPPTPPRRAPPRPRACGRLRVCGRLRGCGRLGAGTAARAALSHCDLPRPRPALRAVAVRGAAWRAASAPPPALSALWRAARASASRPVPATTRQARVAAEAWEA